MQYVDMVIVGASFAGLMCAQAAAKRGLKVIVLERKKSVDSHLHTTGLLTKEAAAECQLPNTVVNAITKARLYSPNMKSLDIHSKDYFFLATDTGKALAYLLQQTQDAGATILFDTSFETAVESNNGVWLPTINIKCRFLIGADGAKSNVARAFNLGINKAFLLGSEVELAGVPSLAKDTFHCFFDHALAPGYLGWLVPSVGMAQVGLACKPPGKPQLSSLLTKLSGIYDINKADEVGHRGGLIPVSGIVDPLYRNNVILLGDAAGFVSPLTAGGIHMAFKFGKLLANAVADNLLSDGAHPGIVLSENSPTLYWKLKQRYFYERHMSNWLCNLMISTGMLSQIAKRVFFYQHN